MQGRYRSLEDGRGYSPNPNPSFRNFNNRTNNNYTRNNSFNRRPNLPAPPPTKQEILMRAGKLAAEYLVSQGLLDPAKLPQNRGQSGKFADFRGLNQAGNSKRYDDGYYVESGKKIMNEYDREDDSENEVDYARGDYYRERKSGFDRLPAMSENTMESRSENQDFMEDSGSKISSSSLNKDALCEVVGDNAVVNSVVNGDAKSDASGDGLKKEIIVEDDNSGDDGVTEVMAQGIVEVDKEEAKEVDMNVQEEKSINKRKREDDDDLLINNVKAKESSPDEEIDAPLEENNEGKTDDETKEEEEEQLSSEPFKTCDLNIMHGSEVIEIHDDPESAQIENEKDEFVQVSCDQDKEVQVGNVEIDVAIDVSSSDPSEPKVEEQVREEPIYPNLDSFLNQHEHVDLSSIHGGYSLEFSDFLGSDITRCPSVPTDLNNLGSGMEGIPNDDDSMYDMTLGEIPLGFMEVWGQPAQDYGKFF